MLGVEEAARSLVIGSCVATADEIQSIAKASGGKIDVPGAIWRICRDATLKLKARDYEAEVAVRAEQELKEERLRERSSPRADESARARKSRAYGEAALLILAEERARASLNKKDVKTEYSRIAPLYASKSRRIQASKILVSTTTTEADIKKALDLKGRAEGGEETFEELIRKHSLLKGTESSLGIFSEATVPIDFPRSFVEEREGQISEPVTTPRGTLLFRIDQVYPPGPLPLDALRERITKRLIARRIPQERDKVLQSVVEGFKADLARTPGLASWGISVDQFDGKPLSSTAVDARLQR